MTTKTKHESEPEPEPRWHKYLVQLDTQMFEQLKKTAKLYDTTVAGVLRAAVRHYFKYLSEEGEGV